jgi:subtilisin family serine protease
VHHQPYASLCHRDLETAMPKLSRAPRSSRRKRPTLLLEQFEPRELPATIDGSFATVALDRLRATPQFAGIDGSGIGIAVIDTGIFAQNPDLQSNVRAWFDAVTLNNNAPDNDPNFAANSLAFAFDPDGHGSHTAGTAASSNPAIGTAPGADIIAIRGLPGPNEARPNFDTVLDR